MNSKKLIVYFFALAVIMCWELNSIPALGDEKADKVETVAVGMTLPQFQLDAPGSESEQKYLGLEDREPFSWSQISFKIIILEIFSIYCPHCRQQGPVLNKIYKFIQEDPELKDGIKMIGIAAGGELKKVERWKTTLNVPFPLYPDPETTIWQKLGKPGVPCTLIVSNSGKIMAVHFGVTENTEDFFRQIKKMYEEQN